MDYQQVLIEVLFKRENMKKIVLLLLALVVSIESYSQDQDQVIETPTNRYEYTLVYAPEKNKLDKKREVLCILDLMQDSNLFYNSDNYQRMKARKYPPKELTKEEQIALAMAIRPGFRWIVESDANSIKYYDKVSQDLFYYIEQSPQDIKWNIEPQVLQWNDFKVQKATTTLDGRDWEVLFTQDIDAIGGPYKFTNLPGFVVKAWDSEEHYVFELLNAKQGSIEKELLALADYEKNNQEKINKAISIENNKTFIQVINATREFISPEDAQRAGLTKKRGDVNNPIQRI